MGEALKLFEQMLEKIGIERALALQLSVATKFQESVREEKDVVLTPQECAFMSVWIDSLIEMRMADFDEVAEPETDPFNVGRPGGVYSF